MRRPVLRVIAGVGAAVLVMITAAGAAVLTLPDLQRPLVDRLIARVMTQDRTALLRDDALRVAVCGSGSPLPDDAAAEPCFAVFAGGRMILVDAGGGSWSRVAQWPTPAGALSDVLVTHFHSDHIADLPVANMQSWVDGRRAPLRVWGGPGVEQVVAGFNQAFAPDSSYRTAHHGAALLPGALAVMEPRLVATPARTPLAGGDTAVLWDDGALRVTAFAVEHPPVTPAYGYRIDYRGRSVVFSGDTRQTPSVAANARGADVLIHEAIDKEVVQAMAEAADSAGRDRLARVLRDIQDYHAAPGDAVAAARAAGVKLVLLNHFVPPTPPWLGDRFRLRGLQTNSQPEGPDIRVAHDGMLVELPLNSDAVVVRRIGR